MESELQAFAPLYALFAVQECWKCHRSQPVVGLGADRVTDERGRPVFQSYADDFLFLTRVEEMPFAVFKYLAQRNHRYMKRASKTAGANYYANTCEHCHSLQGDFHLYSEPGSAFFPVSPEDAARVRYEVMPFTEPLRFVCSVSQGVGRLILAHGKNAA